MQVTSLSETCKSTYKPVKFKNPLDHQIKCMASWDGFLGTSISVPLPCQRQVWLSEFANVSIISIK